MNDCLSGAKKVDWNIVLYPSKSSDPHDLTIARGAAMMTNADNLTINVYGQ